MKNVVIVFLLITPIARAQNEFNAQKREREFRTATAAWFDAWTIVSKKIFGVSRSKPVEILLFDDRYIYSSSSENMPYGPEVVKGPDLLNLKFTWTRRLHNDSLPIPGGKKIGIDLIAFASPIDSVSSKAFFVMPLPSYWKKMGVTSDLKFEDFVTAIFLHEFCHTQQMDIFGRTLSKISLDSLPNQLQVTDDVVQDLFASDSNYRKDFEEEVQLLYASSVSFDSTSLSQALSMLRKRHSKYFSGRYSKLKRLDELFLTMEGFAQYAAYAWLTSGLGPQYPKDVAINGLRRKRKKWSQDEGLGLFLNLEKLTPLRKWANEMLVHQSLTVTELIQKNYTPVEK